MRDVCTMISEPQKNANKNKKEWLGETEQNAFDAII
jgi:hypothetical protein